MPLTQVFYGFLKPRALGPYQVFSFDLKGYPGDGELTLNIVPVLGRDPTCRARVCLDDIGSRGSALNFEITAELSLRSGITDYECQKTSF